MFRICQIDHVVLRVEDLATMRAFYIDVLGCVPERQEPSIGLYQLRAGNSLIDLVPVDSRLGRGGGPSPVKRGAGKWAGKGAGNGPNMDHLCLRIEPFHPDTLVRHLRRHGIEPGPVSSRYGTGGFGPSIYIRDPEGNGVELKGPPQPE